MLARGLEDGFEQLRDEHISRLRQRDEVLK
jgi:hypothetical protein